MTLTPEEAERLFCIARDLLSEPRLADRANKLTAEACHLAGKRQMMKCQHLGTSLPAATKKRKAFLTRSKYRYAKPLPLKRRSSGG